MSRLLQRNLYKMDTPQSGHLHKTKCFTGQTRTDMLFLGVDKIRLLHSFYKIGY